MHHPNPHQGCGMSDHILAVQNEFIGLTTTMYNAVGIIQRDAIPIAPGEKGDDSQAILRSKLVADIVNHSKEIDRNLDLISSEIPEKKAVLEEIESIHELNPEYISKQEERVEVARQKLAEMEATFDELLNEHIGGVTLI
jgi:hypothetical protein